MKLDADMLGTRMSNHRGSVFQEEEVAQAISPKFFMPYPEIANRDLIDAESLKAMEFVWKIRNFDERKVRITIIPDVFVVEEGLVFSADGNLLNTSITQHAPAEVARGLASVEQAERDGNAKTINGTAVLCKKRGARNYGHWLCEMLPKAYIANKYYDQRYLRYITPEITGPLGKVIIESLGLLDMPESATIGVGPEPIKVERLMIVDGMTSHGQYMSPLVMNCTDELSLTVRGGGKEKLFICRGSSTTRRFVNEDAILQIALGHGYTIVDPGTMSLVDQIAAFKSAESIVGVIGAEMTNLSFAPRGCRVTLLVPASMPDTFFWFIAGLRGIKYREVRCRQTGPAKGSAPWDTDLLIEPKDLAALFLDRP